MTIQQLQSAIAYLFPTSKYPGSYTMNVDELGNATIGLWDNTLGSQPTADQLSAVTVAMQLAPAKAAQIATLEASYTTARYGTPVAITSAAGASLSFPTDTATQTNISGYLVAFDASTWPSGGVPLQDNAGAVQMLAEADVKALAQAIANQSMAAWQKLKTLVGQVEAATTIAAVQAVTW